ncbi:MAG TPA: ABC transporter substrate-binding protein [Candidatus Blautia excrementipullorum]|nr:ABC transporter substrate-binding protein [Candidatus Blautia excrementipullorum]
MKKKIMSVLIAAAMVAATAVPAFAADTVKIGVYEPASGDNGAGGKQETLGIQYANSETPTVEIDGTEYTVELDIVDNESSNDKGPSAASQLVSDGVSIVLGSYGSGVSIAASDIFKQGGVPALGVTCTNPQITQGNTHYFRICFLDPFQGTVLANFASEQFEAKKAYVLTKLGDDYSAGLGHYFTQAFEELGGEVVEETFPEGNSDFASYITSAKNAEADVFFAPTSTEAAALIIEQAASQGLEMPIMAGDTWDSNVILNAAKDKDVQIYVTTFYQEGGNEEFDAGMKEYINSDSTNLANNGGDDTIAAVSAMGYDAYYVALEALKAAGSTDPAAVNEALWDVTYDGVCGHVEFDENGDAMRENAYVKTANTETGAWDFVGEQGVASAE